MINNQISLYLSELWTLYSEHFHCYSQSSVIICHLSYY